MIAKEMICTNQEIVMALLNPKSAPMSFQKRARERCYVTVSRQKQVRALFQGPRSFARAFGSTQRPVLFWDRHGRAQ
jgi:hypothetical protein